MISAPEAIISLTSIHRPLSGRLEAHATIKLTMDTQPSAEPTLGSTVSSLDNTVTLKGSRGGASGYSGEGHGQRYGLYRQWNIYRHIADENPVNKSSGVDEMISLSEATWHSVSVDEENHA